MDIAERTLGAFLRIVGPGRVPCCSGLPATQPAAAQDFTQSQAMWAACMAGEALRGGPGLLKAEDGDVGEIYSPSFKTGREQQLCQPNQHTCLSISAYKLNPLWETTANRSCLLYYQGARLRAQVCLEEIKSHVLPLTLTLSLTQTPTSNLKTKIKR